VQVDGRGETVITKEQLHELIDQLSGEELSAVYFYTRFVTRLGKGKGEVEDDPLLAMLRAAPDDDEEPLPGKADFDDEVKREYQRGDFLDEREAKRQLLQLDNHSPRAAEAVE
jgi:hypothetical protein